ncbi:hypothetical protein ACJ73_06867 [Blastomyces percursus]|uniref:PNPLA domain-containing protein n=1 Tax=Blastomyces percursus TaxID=1658174 RepID=A0A1J9Q104_9EURO|nr:hypothetical protein ACJ73_06867 [Blastomyces percursus]
MTMHPQRELLQIVTDGKVIVQDTGRFRRILQEMTHPTSQFPRLVHLIGTTVKDEALRKLFSSSSLGRKRFSGAVDLHVHSPSSSADNPLILLDSDPFTKPQRRNELRSYGEAKQHRVDWLLPSTCTVIDVLLSRFLFLFTDVILLFSHDFASLDDAIARLGTWTNIGSASTLPSTVRPRVMVIVPADAPEDLHIDALLLGRQNAMTGVFHSIELFRWDPNGSRVACDLLKDSILRHAEEMLEVRRSNGCLFSATHLEGFYHRALRHTTRSVDRPFDFIGATRLGTEVGEDYVEHVSNFLKLGFELKVPCVHLAAFIASCILMDAYPPRMHSEKPFPGINLTTLTRDADFPPHIIFHSIYRSFCLKAVERSAASAISGALLCTLIERQMVRLFSCLTKYTTPGHLHRDNVCKRPCDWSRFRSNKTCLYCLRSRPREPLSCGHRVCDTCIRRHGEEAPGVEEKFHIPRCILCQTKGSLTAVLQPMTASISILVIDGGGARGIIPLEFIGLMQEMIDTPFQDLSDMDVGTSSGGITIIYLSILRWSVRRCIPTFAELAARVFSEQPQQPRWLGRLRDMARCAVFNSAYGAKTMEDALKEALEDDRPMISYHPEGFPRKRVIITATEIGSRLCVAFNNYNESEAVSKGRGYKLLGDDDDQIPLWKIARATSAVPGIFPPVEIGSRRFEDGGMGRHNNPIHLALAEARRILPSGMEPDSVLSLGTGVEDEAEDGAKEVSQRSRRDVIYNMFRNFFVFRFFESIMRSTDGEAPWREVFYGLDTPSKASHMRLNVTVDGPLEITNVKVMTSLQKTIRNQPGIREQALKSLTGKLTERFYFVLDARPTCEGKYYRCQGTIRCRGDSRTVALDLIRLGSANMEFVTDTEILGRLTVDSLREDFCSHCHRYRKGVIFHVPYLTEKISICIKSNEMRRKISGFPQSMAWFVDRQGFDACFGSPDHGIPGRLWCATCDSRRAGKRKATGVSQERKAKRRRV